MKLKTGIKIELKSSELEQSLHNQQPHMTTKFKMYIDEVLQMWKKIISDPHCDVFCNPGIWLELHMHTS